MQKFERTKFERPSFLDRPNYKSIGYARVGGSGQAIDAQVSALKEEGCCIVFHETISTRAKEKQRPQLKAALSALDEGDEIVVNQVDLLGRSQVEVVSLIHDLQEKGIHIRTLDGLINTRGLGKFSVGLVGLLSGLAGVERSLARERALANLQYRKENCGRVGGRPRTKPVKEALVLRLRAEGYSYRSIREQTGLALSTIRRIIVEKTERKV